MPYDSLTSRTDAAALIPEQVSTIMLGKATEQSSVLTMFRRIPVSATQVRFPVLSTLPSAYWVAGDTGLKQTTELGWANKFLNVEEIATILPVPDNVIADVERDIWGEAMPLLTEAFARTLDTAVFFGVNAPSSFPTNVVAAALAAGNVNDAGAKTAAQGGFLGDIDAMLSNLENDGFEAEGFVAPISTRPLLRSARDTTGQRLDSGRVSGDLRSIDGFPVQYPMKGLFPAAGGSGVNGVALIGGSWSENFVVGLRKDITLKLLTEATLFDNSGNVMFNLAQQDMTAIRLTFRAGWQVKNTINNQNPNEATRYPAAYIRTLGA